MKRRTFMGMLAVSPLVALFPKMLRPSSTRARMRTRKMSELDARLEDLEHKYTGIMQSYVDDQLLQTWRTRICGMAGSNGVLLRLLDAPWSGLESLDGLVHPYTSEAFRTKCEIVYVDPEDRRSDGTVKKNFRYSGFGKVMSPRYMYDVTKIDIDVEMGNPVSEAAETILVELKEHVERPHIDRLAVDSCPRVYARKQAYFLEWFMYVQYAVGGPDLTAVRG